MITVLEPIQSRDYTENNKYTWGLILDILISNQTRGTPRGVETFYYLLLKWLTQKTQTTHI